MVVSVVIPVRNDADALSVLLASLTALAPDDWEVLVVDGGSTDASAAVARSFRVCCLTCEPGRGAQQDAGVQRSAGELVWFLHADSVVTVGVIHALSQAHRQAGVNAGDMWGRFDVQLQAPRARLQLALSLVGTLMNVRSRLTGICTGDQGIFVGRRLLGRVGGMPRQRLMEDIELSKRLKSHTAPTCLRTRLGTSGRRWEVHGVFRTIVFMWWMRLRYFCGARPEDLAQRYYG